MIKKIFVETVLVTLIGGIIFYILNKNFSFMKGPIPLIGTLSNVYILFYSIKFAISPK